MGFWYFSLLVSLIPPQQGIPDISKGFFPFCYQEDKIPFGNVPYRNPPQEKQKTERLRCSFGFPLEATQNEVASPKETRRCAVFLKKQGLRDLDVLTHLVGYSLGFAVYGRDAFAPL